MARHVTVSCATAPALPLGAEVSIESAVEAEITHWTARIEAVLPEDPDLIVLPEAADRPSVETFGGLDRQLEYLEQRGTRVREHLADIARKNRTIIAYSALRRDGELARNRTEYLGRDGEVVGGYDKNHLVIEEHDETGLEYSDEVSVVDLDFGRVGTAICFDLNFDELRQQYRGRGVELVVFSSEYHGGLMQNYWAYSLRSYLAASIRPPAPSAIVSPLGETIAESTNYFPQVTQRINLDYALAHLDGHWNKLAAMKAKYRDGVNIHDPGRLGSVLITAESPDLGIDQLLQEYEIEPLDDYLDRTRRHRREA
ncbi:MAG: nitrilase, partial [Naasia sp.]|uniref:carbon-nitrogen hydrolase family protein n=1 Tax=Naasia sp. TaxID=2546198 RepID=UPI00260B5747